MALDLYAIHDAIIAITESFFWDTQYIKNYQSYALEKIYEILSEKLRYKL